MSLCWIHRRSGWRGLYCRRNLYPTIDRRLESQNATVCQSEALGNKPIKNPAIDRQTIATVGSKLFRFETIPWPETCPSRVDHSIKSSVETDSVKRTAYFMCFAITLRGRSSQASEKICEQAKKKVNDIAWWIPKFAFCFILLCYAIFVFLFILIFFCFSLSFSLYR